MNEKELQYLKLHQWSYFTLVIGLLFVSAYAESVDASTVSFVSIVLAILCFMVLKIKD
jgi:hypothetical protein